MSHSPVSMPTSLRSVISQESSPNADLIAIAEARLGMTQLPPPLNKDGGQTPATPVQSAMVRLPPNDVLNTYLTSASYERNAERLQRRLEREIERLTAVMEVSASLVDDKEEIDYSQFSAVVNQWMTVLLRVEEGDIANPTALHASMSSSRVGSMPSALSLIGSHSLNEGLIPPGLEDCEAPPVWIRTDRSVVSVPEDEIGLSPPPIILKKFMKPSERQKLENDLQRLAFEHLDRFKARIKAAKRARNREFGVAQDNNRMKKGLSSSPKKDKKHQMKEKKRKSDKTLLLKGYTVRELQRKVNKKKKSSNKA